ncbi:MAG: hypothetical protein H6838_01650 [Planctomycetes bacterium]|nr:hypothetical protein [Planctomycetota bacterium]MCB9884162.1 hypothetical protein [Planctomycetota bacterium]
MTSQDTDARDLLGNALSADDRELLDLYRRLHALSRRDDLPPVATANVKQAMVLLWNACNDLALLHEEPGCD